MSERIFLTLESSAYGTIKGSVKDAGFEELIEVYSTENMVESSTSGRGRARSKKVYGPYNITKGIDLATVPTYNAWFMNERITTCKIECYHKSPGGTMELYYTVELEDARLDSIKQELANPKLSDVKEQEVLSFTYRSIKWTFAEGNLEASTSTTRLKGR